VPLILFHHRHILSAVDAPTVFTLKAVLNAAVR
jgi:hypothetical protein